MSETTVLSEERSQQLDEAIGAYYEAIDCGEAPDPSSGRSDSRIWLASWRTFLKTRIAWAGSSSP